MPKIPQTTLARAMRAAAKRARGPETRFTLRLPPKLAARAVTAAAGERRSLNSCVLDAVAAWCAKRDGGAR